MPIFIRAASSDRPTFFVLTGPIVFVGVMVARFQIFQTLSEFLIVHVTRVAKGAERGCVGKHG